MLWNEALVDDDDRHSVFLLQLLKHTFASCTNAMVRWMMLADYFVTEGHLLFCCMMSFRDDSFFALGDSLMGLALLFFVFSVGYRNKTVVAFAIMRKLLIEMRTDWC